MAKRYWGRSQATRELSFSIYNSLAKQDAKEKINEILKPETQNRLKNYSKELEKIQIDLESSYNRIMDSALMDSDIFEDLLKILSQNDVENQHNLAKELFANNSIKDQSFKNDINSYIYNYNRMYNGIINASEEVNSIMEKFRGDHMLYGIGTPSSLTIMSRTAYSELERNNRDLFELKYTYTDKGGYKLSQLQFTDETRLLSTGNTTYSTLKGRLEALSYERNDVIYNILPYNNGNTGVSFKNTWNTLRSTTIYSAQALNKTEAELAEMKNTSKYAWAARKLEYLFEPGLDLNNLSQQLNYKINNAENTLGFATGDVNIATRINGQDYNFALQMKYANGNMPWNGTSISSLQNSLKFLSNKDGLFKEFSNAISNNDQRNAMDNFFKDKFNYSLNSLEKQNENYARQEIDKIFNEAFGGNPLFMDFLNSEECEDMKIDIYNAWIDESTEMNNEEAESIEEDTSW